MSLLSAITIGNGAFEGCTGAENLTVTLGNMYPTLGEGMFSGVESPKTVTVRVPPGADAWIGLTGSFTGDDTADTWGNGFRGGGWSSGAAMTNSSAVNSNISLTVEEYTP